MGINAKKHKVEIALCFLMERIASGNGGVADGRKKKEKKRKLSWFVPCGDDSFAYQLFY